LPTLKPIHISYTSTTGSLEFLLRSSIRSTMSGTASMPPPIPSCNCTYAVTGPLTCWQAIFVCETCHLSDAPLCVCQGCSETCHADHDVEFIGMGPSYCDCRTMGSCTLVETSKEVAEQLGIVQGSPSNAAVAVNPSNQLHHDNTYIQDVYQILEIHTTFCDALIQQAKELAKISKETFWLDPNAGTEDKEMSTLERLAHKILLSHQITYNLPLGGAEWWVQIKSTDPTSSITNYQDFLLSRPGNPNEAVDLHYDKDELLAEHFDLGSFPILSTVTYLTQSNSNPTIIFPHRYDQSVENSMTHMIVSHPKVGKHVVFDGRLLHGAPSHPALRQQINDDDKKNMLRITFLVNFWESKPCGIQPLPAATRDKLNELFTYNDLPLWNNVTLSNQPLTIVEIFSKYDLPLRLQGRICVPFLSKTATWSSDENSLYITMYPPPPVEENGATLLVRFGEGMEACFDSLGEYENNSVGNEVGKDTIDHQEEGSD